MNQRKPAHPGGIIRRDIIKPHSISVTKDAKKLFRFI